jgi:hypothetical protein
MGLAPRAIMSNRLLVLVPAPTQMHALRHSLTSAVEEGKERTVQVLPVPRRALSNLRPEIVDSPRAKRACQLLAVLDLYCIWLRGGEGSSVASHSGEFKVLYTLIWARQLRHLPRPFAGTNTASICGRKYQKTIR